MIDLSAARRPAPRGVVARMARAIVHRGPDEDGFLERPGMHLANRRLSIVGLADGKQPISNENQTVWTVFNGELFDYPEKRKELEGKGHVFRTHTDTELIPHLWEEYGDKMFDHLRGQFAICLWDSRTNEFILARDRAGICPLFYAHRKIDGTDWLLFASEAKALFASGLVTARPDLDGINHIFTFFAMPGPTTVYEGVSVVTPGRYMQFTPGAGSPERLLRQRTYWEVNYPDQGHEDYGRDEAALVKGFEEVLYAAVSRRLRADVPVVSYLSGGVDSSLVVAMASRALGRPIPTFTVSVQEKGLNEENEALQTAKHLGCTPVVVKCGHDELRANYPELIEAAEFPVIDTACLGLMHLARAVRNNGYKVVLTGEGADEWLGGYPWFKIHRATQFLDAIPGFPLGYRVRSLILKASGEPTYPADLVYSVQKALGGHNGWMDVYGMMSLNKIRFFSPALKERILLQSAYDNLELTPNMHRWHPFNRQMYLGARIMLAGHLLASKGDRVAMHSSVEGRYPFLDEDVVAYMAKVHPRWKLRGLFRDKYIERKVAERWLPKEVAWRRKVMFRAPMDSWIKGHDAGTSADAWVDQVLSPESVNKTGFFDHTAITAARQKLARARAGSLGKTGLEMGLTAVVATQLWHHLYVSGDLAALPSRVPSSAESLGEAA
ncbi:Asparagine synthetase [glutamine-hydrolyzing] [Fimbriiglobus ruber]|uniref:asparagine synthase (glutamine-hydrolyzing) n=2 Tax=Fimbriiglobus ruber TaxID=1908690 RepID=A0A225D8D7_9BACT|nr:Asparagine synthetase [glutamine-hydrolyzing] [Fimbriiglobus ruber]